MNRLGIFFFYDAQGVVDDYVTTLLDGLAPHFTEMAIVCNGELTDEGRAKLARYTGNITVRANQGFDAWAYKTAMDSYGWDALTEFDEIVLFNATIMGPVHPFSEMFDAMDKRDLDFWGITKFHKVPFDPHPVPLPRLQQEPGVQQGIPELLGQPAPHQQLRGLRGTARIPLHQTIRRPRIHLGRLRQHQRPRRLHLRANHFCCKTTN